MKILLRDWTELVHDMDGLPIIKKLIASDALWGNPIAALNAKQEIDSFLASSHRFHGFLFFRVNVFHILA